MCLNQTIIVKSGKIPKIEIVCIENCQDVYLPSQTGKYVIKCHNCAGENPSYEFKNNQWGIVSKNSISFDKDKLTAGSTFKIEGKVVINSGKFSDISGDLENFQIF